MGERRDGDDFLLLALFAGLLGGSAEDTPYLLDFYKYLRSRGRFRELAHPEFEYLLEKALFVPRRRRTDELREIVMTAVEGIRSALGEQGQQLASLVSDLTRSTKKPEDDRLTGAFVAVADRLRSAVGERFSWRLR